MALTQYQPYGLPGQIKSFSAKAAAATIILNIISNSGNVVDIPPNHIADSGANLLVAGDIEVQGDGWFDGEFTFAQVATGIFPTAGYHLATKEYIDLAIGASFDLFLSDTDDGVVADTHVMYAEETDEAETTEDSPSLSNGDNQLALSWLSEAGVPGTATIREGVYDCHIHLNKNSGGATTTVYWKLSYVDSNGTSGKILIATSETSDAITTSEVGYNLHAVVTEEVPLGATKRLLFEVYVNISVGSNVTLTATLEGVINSHISFQLPSSIWQHHGDVLDDLNTVGQVGADSEFLVGTGAGVLAWESGATARTSIGLGTGDSPTFSGLSISGQSHLEFQSANNYIFGYSISQLHLISTGEIHLVAGGAYSLKVIHDLGCLFNAGLYITEQAAAGGDTATYGQLWVKDGSPNTLWFTNDASGDYQIGGVMGSIVIADGGTIGQSAGPLLTFDDTNDFLEITGCKVGFGINDPAARVHIVDDSVTAGIPLILSNQDTTANNSAWLLFRSKNSVGVELNYAAIRTKFINHTEDAQEAALEFFVHNAVGAAGTAKVIIKQDGGIHFTGLKSGTDQANAGAAANELYRDTNDDNTIKMGV